MQVTAQRVSVRTLAGLRIVVVDDDRVSLMAITAMVGSWGAEIASSASGAYALRLIVEGTPDLFLCDLYMPDMDGFDLMKRVRELPPGQGGMLCFGQKVAIGQAIPTLIFCFCDDVPSQASR